MSHAVGTPIERPDGRAKVTGRAAFVADLAVGGCLVGGVVRSPVPRGRIDGFDFDPAFDFARVTVVTRSDIPGDNVVAMIADDWPILADREVHHHGEPLLLVAAPDAATLAAARAAIRPRITPLEPRLDAERSDRVFHTVAIDKGDPDGVFARAARVVEGTYRTGTQEQMYLEPQGVVALPPGADGVVTVHGSMQCPFYVQKALCRALALPPERCRVVQAVTGGGFGGKEDYPSALACHAALLAVRAGRPVRLLLDRHEDLAVTPKRHPSVVRLRAAVDDDGRLLALDVDVLLDGGAYTTLSPVVLSRGCIHAAGPYRCAHVRIRGRVVATNHVPYGAFRGFGAPQTCFAIERLMDRIAVDLGIHPFEVRRRNALVLGDTTATSQRLDDGVGSLAVLDRAAARTGFDAHAWRAPRTGRIRRGRGLSFFFHGAGFTGSGETHLRARVAVDLRADGRALVRSSSTEFGQGTLALFRALAAEALGCEPMDVDVAPADTLEVPDSGPTVASRTCMIVGAVLARACRELAARVGPGDEPFMARARRFVAAGGDGRVEAVYRPPEGLRWDDATYRGDAYPAYGWGADVVDVEVDLDTFEVRASRVFSAVAVARAIQPQLVRGQIEGGSLQAIGFAHLEVVDMRDGRFAQDRMSTCIVPTAEDAPEFDVELVEVPCAHGPSGAKGVGELPMDGGAPAVLSAIEDALGLHVTSLPATPERLMECWLDAHPEERL